MSKILQAKSDAVESMTEKTKFLGFMFPQVAEVGLGRDS